MPFHPNCFDIFTRLSTQRLGTIDVHGLISWRNLNFHDISDKPVFSLDPNVRRASAQHWIHHSGSEYLAANPLYIPGLKAILEAASGVEASFSSQQSAFPALLTSGRNTWKEDPFLALPQEIRECVVDYLSSKQIAALRLASRAFHQLPIGLWYHLLVREMPWLWEVYSSHVPSLWTALQAREVKASLLAREKREKERNRRRRVIAMELPEILEAWDADWDDVVENGVDVFREAERRAVDVARRCVREGTNWFALYRDVRRAGLKGLRNRERIWGDVGRIVDDIGRLREEGKIVD